jgi:hypothetical protein
MLSYMVSGLAFPFYSPAPARLFRGLPSRRLRAALRVLRLTYLAATVLMFATFPPGAFKAPMLCSLFPVHALAIGAALPPRRKPAYWVNNCPFGRRWWQAAPRGVHLAPYPASSPCGGGLARLVFFNSIFSAGII